METSKILGTGSVVANYPSGQQVRGFGKLFVARLPQAGLGPYLDNGTEIFALDPRAVIRLDGEVKYRPRSYGLFLSQPFREWLDENPQWDAPGTPPA